MELGGCGRCGHPPTQATVTEIESRRSVGAAFAVLQSIAVCREEFEPSLDSGVALSNLGEDLERLVVRKNAEGGIPQRTTEALDAPDNAVSLEIEQCPVARLLKTPGRIEPSFCSCSRVAPKQSTLASQ